ncbi:MAG: hypothetical protein CFH41_01187 [Alphaproteobacteria bacterium MarineAlpha11_Bin1]|nr:MAG: hypothetical protein CFH41_01187 [Alphaproteobacteria bacterium MarineAlpha11_Bin1]|tara:strand:+ start:22488 stop:22853 length:366 start_codon:yes stop_codon:yes gene_type:complete
MAGSEPRATDIKVNRVEKTLEIIFDDGTDFLLPAEYLRVESPSAEVQGHGPGQKILVAGRRHVGIANVEPVGNYAIRIVFDDLHDTGIFSWRYLYQLGAEFKTRWEEYLAAIDSAGLRRDP